MKRKSDIVREAVAAGNFKEALRIATSRLSREIRCAELMSALFILTSTGSSGRTSRQPSMPALRSSLRFTDKENSYGEGVLLHQA